MLNQSFSAIIPLYNHESYIGAAIQSLLSQEIPPREIIVVDDGSTDGSGFIVSDLAAKHQEIIFWRQPNQGAHQAINAGIHRATGDIVAILNSDDLHAPRRLKACGEVLASNPGVAAVCTGISFVDGTGKNIKFPWYNQSKAFYVQSRDLPLSLINGNFLMTTSNLVIRRDVFQTLGYFSRLRYAHDLDFFLRLIAAGLTIHILDDSLLQYRSHGKNTILEEQTKIRVEWAFATARFLHTIWEMPAWKAKGWDFSKRVFEILEIHSLSKLVLMFLAYFRGHIGTGDFTSFADDPDLLHLLHTMAAE